jgi:transposase
MPRGSNFQRPYPPEFRREAVGLYRRGGRTLREIASDLGVSSESLRMWVRQAGIDAGQREGLTTELREELRRLREGRQYSCRAAFRRRGWEDRRHGLLLPLSRVQALLGALVRARNPTGTWLTQQARNLGLDFADQGPPLPGPRPRPQVQRPRS